MTEDPTPTTLRRQLGAELRILRKRKRMTAKDLADELGFSESKVSRIESGARAVSPEDIAALTGFFELEQDLARRLRELARSAKRRRAPAPHPTTPESEHLKFVQSGFLELERDADRIREFNSGLVPGLLQTERYMRELIEAALSDLNTHHTDQAVALRLRRQEGVQARPYAALVDEAVLARVVGGPDVMREQLLHIERTVAASGVEFGVIPFSAGAHPGHNSVFVMLSTERENVPDTVFVEGLAGLQTFDKVDDVRRFDQVWSRLAKIAETGEPARRRLGEYIDRYA